MGLFQLTMYGTGLILGAGIYVLIGEATGLTGNSVWLSFLLGGIVAIFAGLSYAELTALFPRAAAEYIFVKKAFKSNFIAFIIGWLTVVTSMITAATVSLGFGGYVSQFLDIHITISAIALLGALSFVNFIGIRESAWMNAVFALITIGGLVLIIALGVTFVPSEPIDYMEMPFGVSGLIMAFVLIFFAFIGFEDMANVSEEVKRPGRNMPRGIILSVIITSIIYVLVSLAAIRILNWEVLAASSAPLADVAQRAMGTSGKITLSAIALFATASTVLITLVAGARILYGMARDGSLPSLLSKVHSKKKTPWVAVIGILVTGVAFSFIGDIVIVANIVVFSVVITYAMINLAVILLRYVEPDLQRPFRVPINIGRFPILPLISLAITVYMAFQFDLEIILVGMGIIGTGVVFYFFYRKK